MPNTNGRESRAPEIFLTPAEAVCRLGNAVSPRTLRHLANVGQIRTRRVGRGHRRYSSWSIDELAGRIEISGPSSKAS